MINRDYIASELYRVYCDAVGGVAFNGDPLPDWETFVADPSKKKQSDAWLVAADRAIQVLDLPRVTKLGSQKGIEPKQSFCDFSMALSILKNGFPMQRSGWNGKGLFVYMVPANSYPAQTGVAKAHFGEGSLVPYGAYLAIKGVDGVVNTWVPSISDIMAEDWGVVDLHPLSGHINEATSKQVRKCNCRSLPCSCKLG
jgi:hypothetical protein